MSNSISLSDIAYKKLKRKRKEVLFNKLWKEVIEEAGYTEELARRKISSFYNALMLDARFISLEGNMWDLRERHTLDSLQIDPEILSLYDDYDDEEFDDVDEEEEAAADDY